MKKDDKYVFTIEKKHIYFIVVALVFFIGGSLVNFMLQSSKQQLQGVVVEKGDTVEVNYIGRLENGTVFDTSYEDVGKEAGLDKTYYKILEFTVGSGEVIEGIDEAIIGMKLGEEKDVTIPPEKAFGLMDEKLIQSIPRIQSIPMIQNISLQQFRQAIGNDPVLNMTFQPQGLEWPIRVLNITNATVIFRHEPALNMTIQSVFGEAKVSVADTEIQITENPIPGAMIVTRTGPAKVLSVNETTIRLDFNHPLAGETIMFSIKIENVKKSI